MWGATFVPNRLVWQHWISIHAPRVGSDSEFRMLTAHRILFQSTLPVWGATRQHSIKKLTHGYFNPRSPCGERHILHSTLVRGIDFNPRSPCGERRVCSHHQSFFPRYFNPRSPCGERPWTQATPVLPDPIFQSTLPVWGATVLDALPVAYFVFQSTLPVWGATVKLVPRLCS